MCNHENKELNKKPALGLGCDQAGFELMKSIRGYLEESGIEFIDFGVFSGETVDYPDIAEKVVSSILSGECSRGILICGTGIGISMAANRHKGIRAALCHDVFSAKATRLHNDANILAMGGRVIGSGLAIEITSVFLNTAFSNEQRHINRIALLEK